jgi:hypothetical protein
MAAAKPAGNAVARSRKVLMKLADIIAHLRDYDEAPFNGQSPSIYVAEPWGPTSDALVEWSGEKGGVPSGRKPLFFI